MTPTSSAKSPLSTDVRAQVLAREPHLRKRLGDDMALNIRAPSDLWLAAVEPDHINQTLDALAQDAHDAQHGYGNVTIRLQNVLIQGPHPVLAPGEYVKLSLLDTREDPPGDLSPKLPAILENELCAGGCIRHAYWSRAMALSVAASEARSQTLLLVEDDDLVRFALLRGLRAYGYHVFAAETAEEALRLRTPHNIDLLVTDLVMPGLSGLELAERLLAQNRISRVLFVSGYPSQSIDDHCHLRADVAYLQKPFTPSELEVKIRAIFDATTPQKP